MLGLFSHRVYSQKTASGEGLTNEAVLRFEKFLLENYMPDNGKVKLLCENSCVFAKFKVSLNGKIVNLTFGKNTPSVISDALVIAFRKTEINKRSTFGFQSEQRVYLLPIVYYYNEGCYIMKKENDEKIARHDSTATIIEEEKQGTATYHILEFNDKMYDTFGCTVLNPIELNKKMNN
jgi:hypothetical protein